MSGPRHLSSYAARGGLGLSPEHANTNTQGKKSQRASHAHAAFTPNHRKNQHMKLQVNKTKQVTARKKSTD